MTRDYLSKNGRMNKRGIMLLSIVGLGYIIFMALALSSTKALAGQEEFVGKVQLSFINNYERINGEKIYPFIQWTKHEKNNIIVTIASNGGYLDLSCNKIWDFSKCMPDSKELLNKFPEILKEDIKSQFDLDYSVELKDKILSLKTDYPIKYQDEKVTIEIKPDFKLSLNYDFTDYDKIKEEVKNNADCVLESKNDCFQGSDFEYIVKKEQNLINYQVKTGKVIASKPEEVIVSFNVKEETLKSLSNKQTF